MDTWATLRGYYTIDTTDLNPHEVARLIAGWRDRGYKPPRSDLLTVSSPGESEGEEPHREEAEASPPESQEGEEEWEAERTRQRQRLETGEAKSS